MSDPLKPTESNDDTLVADNVLSIPGLHDSDEALHHTLTHLGAQFLYDRLTNEMNRLVRLFPALITGSLIAVFPPPPVNLDDLDPQLTPMPVTEAIGEHQAKRKTRRQLRRHGPHPHPTTLLHKLLVELKRAPQTAPALTTALVTRWHWKPTTATTEQKRVEAVRAMLRSLRQRGLVRVKDATVSPQIYEAVS